MPLFGGKVWKEKITTCQVFDFYKKFVYNEKGYISKHTHRYTHIYKYILAPEKSCKKNKKIKKEH